MNKETLELIKETYKQKTGLKRVKVEPVFLNCLGRSSEVWVKINGKKHRTYTFKDKTVEIMKVR